LIDSEKWQEIFEILSLKDSAVNEWNYVSTVLPTEYIINQNQYIYFWNWDIVLSRVSEEYLLGDGVVDRIQFILNQIDESEQLWEIVIEKFSTSNLIEIIRNYSETNYHWKHSIL
jgi:hypothetical protein